MILFCGYLNVSLNSTSSLSALFPWSACCFLDAEVFVSVDEISGVGFPYLLVACLLPGYYTVCSKMIGGALIWAL